jgi:hypothetical protein
MRQFYAKTHEREAEGFHWIAVSELPRLQKVIAQYRAKADKLGVEGPSLLVTGNEQMVEVDDGQVLVGSKFVSFHYGQPVPAGRLRRMPVAYEAAEIQVSGPAPKLNGWRFLARLEHTSAGNLFYGIPREHVSPVYRDRAPICEHCRAQRHRKDTYIVRHDDGREAQVGSTCLADFLGHKDPKAIAALLSVFGWGFDDMFSDGEGSGGFAESSKRPIQWAVALAATVIRQDGFKSREKTRESIMERATADYVSHLLYAKSLTESEAERYEVTEADRQRADAAIQWAANLSDAEANANNYLGNLRVLARSAYIDHKHLGLLTSMIPAFDRAMGKIAEAKGKSGAESAHVGDVGQKLEFDAELIRHYAAEGFYGPTSILTFRDALGNIFVWFASGGDGAAFDASGQPLIGKQFHLKGTVKGHKEFKGQKQTNLTRVKLSLLEVVPA